MPLLLARLSNVLRLPSQVRDEVNSLEFDSSSPLKRLPDVERAFANLTLVHNISTLLEPITDATMDGLEVCSSMLSQFRPHQVPSQDELNALNDLIEELIIEIQDSDLDADLCLFLLEHLHEMQAAIDEFRIVGTEALERAVQRAIGHAGLQSELAGKAKDSAQGRKFWRIVEHAALLVTTVGSGLQLAEAVVPSLGPGGGPDSVVVVVDRDTSIEVDADIEVEAPVGSGTDGSAGEASGRGADSDQ